MQTAARAYLKTQVNTTSQGDILILLYEGALKYLAQAKEKIAARDYAAKGILISRALDILTELQSSLNAQKGGELADNLQRLYFYCSRRLLLANLKMDTDIIDEVIRILSGLSEAFRTANAEVSGGKVPRPEKQDGPYGVAPPGMASSPVSTGQSGSQSAFPGFASRPRPAMARVASASSTTVMASDEGVPNGGDMSSALGAAIGDTPPHETLQPAAVQKPAVGNPQAAQAQPQSPAHSPMRRAFAAYATARDQKTGA
ncbi:MAG: flagellar export chaperone FliS [Thermodesulfobacteriota bacterium]